MPVHRERELPAEVVGVLDPGVHALAARGRVQMRGVARDEGPADPVPVDDPVADPEDRRPAEVAAGGAGRGEPVERDLEIGQRRRFVLLGEAGRHLGAGRLRHDARRRHGRHPVAARAPQRDAHQHPVELTVGHVHETQQVPLGHRPVDVEVGEHEQLREPPGPGVEGQPQLPADDAVRAVATDDVLGMHRFPRSVGGGQVSDHVRAVLGDGV